MNRAYDEIKIHLPQKADYVSLIRLSVSGIASKLGFDIDTIEDIKVAVSEVCNRIISIKPDDGEFNYDITFHLFETGFKAMFTVNNALRRQLFEGESGEFAKAIISSLMDSFEITCNGDCVITMVKNLGD
ncbi:MAG: anti-sigma regulatory factor [Clostridiaceae bacterium]|jgi:serine/threonine-protein kinase RsbW|nr:anti-sigma regulatory factor [Clostridiaceae bacterium]